MVTISNRKPQRDVERAVKRTDIVTLMINRSQRRRDEMDRRRRKGERDTGERRRGEGGGGGVHTAAGPPYPGPNPRRPNLALDTTIIFP